MLNQFCSSKIKNLNGIRVNDFLIPLNEYFETDLFFKCISVDTTSKTWTANKAILNNGIYSFGAEVFTLNYDQVTPVVNGIYNGDALVKIENLYTGPTSSKIVYWSCNSTDVATNEQGGYYLVDTISGIGLNIPPDNIPSSKGGRVCLSNVPNVAYQSFDTQLFSDLSGISIDFNLYSESFISQVSNDIIFEFFNGTANDGFRLTSMTDDGNTYHLMVKKGSNTSFPFSGFMFGMWKRVTITYSAESGYVNAYIDKSSAISEELTQSAPFGSNSYFKLFGGGNMYWSVQNFSIYNYELSSTEVQNLT